MAIENVCLVAPTREYMTSAQVSESKAMAKCVQSGPRRSPQSAPTLLQSHLALENAAPALLLGHLALENTARALLLSHLALENVAQALLLSHVALASFAQALLLHHMALESRVRICVRKCCPKKLCSATLDSVTHNSAPLFFVHGYAWVRTSIYIYIYIYDTLRVTRRPRSTVSVIMGWEASKRGGNKHSGDELSECALETLRKSLA